jgi:hypothetical protein
MPGAADAVVVVGGGAVVGGVGSVGAIVELAAPGTGAGGDGAALGLAVLPHETSTAPRQAARAS